MNNYLKDLHVHY